MPFEIKSGLPEKCGVVGKLADSRIARSAQQTPKFLGPMAVIDVQTFGSSAAADVAKALLSYQGIQINKCRYSVQFPIIVFTICRPCNTSHTAFIPRKRVGGFQVRELN
jgi:hypothetical protein